MDVLKLNRKTFFPVDDGLVENYETLIWTERYSTPGDFVIKTGDIENTMNMLPPGTLITLLDSFDVMMVETHEIEYDEANVPSLSVKGRSLTMYIDHRYLRGDYNKKSKTAKAWTPAQTVEVLLWNSFVNDTTTDVTRNNNYDKSAKDRIKNVVVTHSAGTTGKDTKRWLVPGSVGEQLKVILDGNRLGLRVIRPGSGPADVVSVDTGTKQYSKDTVNVINDLRFDVYRGSNKTAKVVFKHLGGDLNKPKYLFANTDYKSAAFIDSEVGGLEVSRDDQTRILTRRVKGDNVSDGDLEASGLDRRMLFVDGGSKDQGETNSEFKDDLPNDARDELAAHDEDAHVDAELDPNVPYKYGKDYRLGDIVLFRGRWGIVQEMVVSEYIRTEDAEGFREFPTLSVL